MRIHLVGLGPIGCLLAHHLRQALPPKHAIAVVHKTAARAVQARLAGNTIKFETGGVVVESKGFEHEVFDPHDPEMQPSAPGRLTQAGRIHSANDPIDALILCTKANHTVPTISALLPRLSARSTIVLMQNGMGVYEMLVDKLFRNPELRPHFVLAAISHGATLKQYGHVVHRGAGSITFGAVPDSNGRNFEAHAPNLSLDDVTPNTPDDPHASRYLSLRNTLAALSSLESLKASWRPIYDVHMAMRHKVVVNSVVNPLTALMGCRNGDILRSASGREIIRNVCHEASDVFRAQWRAEVEAMRERGADVGGAVFPVELETEALRQSCVGVVEGTAGNYSSMLRDVQQGRGTEVQFMNGYLVRLGRQYKVSTPTTKLLLRLIDMRTKIALPPDTDTPLV